MKKTLFPAWLALLAMLVSSALHADDAAEETAEVAWTRPRISDVKIEPSYRKKSITVTVQLEGLENVDVEDGDRFSSWTYFLEKTGENEFDEVPGRLTRFSYGSRYYPGHSLHGLQSLNGRLVFTLLMKDPAELKLWDINTPENRYYIGVNVYQWDGEEEESAPRNGMWTIARTNPPVPFGFREFWGEDGKTYFNGSPIELSGVSLDALLVNDRTLSVNDETAEEIMRRLKSSGVNIIYLRDDARNPAPFNNFAEMLQAADDVGMLVAFPPPADGEQTDDQASLVKFLAKEAQNHPSVIFHSMSREESTGDKETK